MPIVLPKGLPARHALEAEGIRVLAETPPDAAGAPPLRIALLNLMPRKTTTEIQIARLLGDTARTVELTLAVPDSYVSTTTPAIHLSAFYRRWTEIRDARFDALIVTGAPVELLPFEAVTYWRDMTRVLDWADRNATRSYYICWAAQAALYHFHGVPKHMLPRKRFGVYRQAILQPDNPLFDCLPGHFPTPVSRHTETRQGDLPRIAGLTVLAGSPQSGLCMVEDRDRRAIYMFNHLEYDAGTLAEEYRRDRDAGADIALPEHYYPSDDPSRPPFNTWRPYARRVFRNWLGGNEPAAERQRVATNAA
jgi:homoserine O-succinyltransferase